MRSSCSLLAAPLAGTAGWATLFASAGGRSSSLCVNGGFLCLNGVLLRWLGHGFLWEQNTWIAGVKITQQLGRAAWETVGGRPETSKTTGTGSRWSPWNQILSRDSATKISCLSSMTPIADENDKWASYAGPGGWNGKSRCINSVCLADWDETRWCRSWHARSWKWWDDDRGIPNPFQHMGIDEGAEGACNPLFCWFEEQGKESETCSFGHCRLLYWSDAMFGRWEMRAWKFLATPRSSPSIKVNIRQIFTYILLLSEP